MSDAEYELQGGNTALNVVRVGDTVRKPLTRATNNVEAFLQYLEGIGFPHSPRSLGRDNKGRYIIEFIEGETVDNPQELTLVELGTIARIIRELHTASASFPVHSSAGWEVAIPPDTKDLICHNDLGPWNLVRHSGRWVFIDWDGSGPASRMWDLAYAAQSFVPLAEGNPAIHAERLRAFVDGYRLDAEERQRFPAVLVQRTWAGYQLLERSARTGQQPWARMYAEGHGQYWLKAAKYVEQHRNIWAAAIAA